MQSSCCNMARSPLRLFLCTMISGDSACSSMALIFFVSKSSFSSNLLVWREPMTFFVSQEFLLIAVRTLFIFNIVVVVKFIHDSWPKSKRIINVLWKLWKALEGYVIKSGKPLELATRAKPNSTPALAISAVFLLHYPLAPKASHCDRSKFQIL